MSRKITRGCWDWHEINGRYYRYCGIDGHYRVDRYPTHEMDSQRRIGTIEREAHHRWCATAENGNTKKRRTLMSAMIWTALQSEDRDVSGETTLLAD